MRVLISTHPELSHLLPMLPAVWALRAAGHEVLVLAPPNLSAAVQGLGLDVAVASREADPTAVLQEALAKAGADAVPVSAWSRPDGAFWGRIAVRFAQAARELLPDYLAVARGWRPDLLMTCPMEAAGRLAGGVLGLPVVVHRWGVDPLTEDFEDRLREHLAPDCRSLKLPGLPAPATVIDPCPPSLQLPGVPAGLPVRYVPANGSGVQPDWARQAPRAPRICVTFGNKTRQMRLDKVADWVLAGIARLGDAEVVLALPGAVATGHPVPAENVIVGGGTRLSLFLRDCAAVVHHGGSGTGMTAAAFGVPQLVLPQFSDQFAFAERVAHLGNGVRLGTAEEQRDPGRVRDALHHLLTDPGPARAARRLAEEIAGRPSPATLVPALEKLAAAPAARR